nr:hypothetical protein [Streptomyces paludis]
MTTLALVVGRFLDVLAWNPLAGVLLGEFTQQPLDGRNLLALLLHPEADRACPDRAATVVELTAMLRAQVADGPGHPRAVELVGELAVRSDEFAATWARHDVVGTTRGRMRLNHPLIGETTLDWDAYPMPGAPGRQCVGGVPGVPMAGVTPAASARTGARFSFRMRWST